MILFHSFELPWSAIQEEVERLKRLVVVCLAITVIVGAIVPFIPVPKKDLSKEEQLPPRLAQLVMQQKEKPKPPPPKKVEKKEEKKEKKKEEKKEKKKEKPKEKKKPEKTQAQKVAEARAKAQKSGLLAFADELADLRDKKIDQTLNTTKKLSKGATQSKQFERNVLTSNVPASSGGIDTSSLSRGISGNTRLEGRQTTKVESDIEKVAAQGRVTKSSGNKPKRTLEEVSIVFDRNKGSIYSLYNRALRKDPGIAGKVVFEIIIASDGSVVDVKVISSELNNPSLERKLIVKIKSFLFDPKDGAENLVVTYPLDFVPS